MSPTKTIKHAARAMGGAVVLAAAALTVNACSSSTGGSTGPNGKARYYMTANIDGTAWAEDDFGASTVGVVLAGPGLYTITAFSTASATTIALTLNTIRGPDTYPLGVNIGVAGGTAQVSNTTAGWATRLSGAAGTITITSLTQTEMIGTFTFVANGVFNAATTSTKNVTSGTFDLPITVRGAAGPIPDNAGNKISGAIGGAQFNLATIAVTTGVTTNAQGQAIGTKLIFGGANDTQGMGATVSAITGVGVYALSNGTNPTTLNASVTNGSVINAWNSAAGASSGSVTITSWTATRAKGTFVGTLAGQIGTSTSVNISGAFDIGLP